MRLFKCTTAIAMAFVAVGFGNAAFAASFTSGQSGAWNSGATWGNSGNDVEGSGYPGPNDNATVAPSHVVHVDATVSVNNLSVNDASAPSNPGTLEMRASGIMKVETSVDVENDLSRPGVFRFAAGSGTAPILRASASSAAVSVDGPFTVTGSQGASFDQEDSSRFHTQAGFTLTSGSGAVTISAPIENDGTITATNSSITISGDVLSGSTGTFRANGANMTFSGDVENDGTIDARGGSDLTFNSTSLINAGSSGLFSAGSSSTDMIFNHASAVTITSGADFLITAGRMYFQQDLETDGGFKQTGGTIEADAGEVFKATGAYPI